MLTPFFALMVLGTVDASRAVSEKMRLQQAASRVVEMVSAGGLASDAFANMATEGAAAANVPAANVAVDSWLECDRVRQASFDGDCPANQEIGRYASIAINNSYAPWFASSLAGIGYSVSRTITVQGRASVRLQ